MTNPKILIVEDESVIARDIQGSLEYLGYEVVGIEVTGEEAIESIASLKPDLVLMDIVLQGEMDGIEAAKYIYNTYKIPVIYLTAYTDEIILERAKTSEPFGYLIKPFENKELRFTIETALYKHKTEDELRKANRALKTLSSCNNAIVHATDEQNLLIEICRIIVDVGGYPMAWVGLPRHDAKKSVEPVAWYGKDKDFIRNLKIYISDPADGQCPTTAAIRSGMPIAIQHISSEENSNSWARAAAGQGYSSCIALPLLSENKTLGALTIYARETNSFDADEFDLLVDLANNLAYWIVALQHRTEREKAEKALQESHERFTTVLDSLDAIVYVADMQSDEVLFANKYVRDIFGDVVGKLCWQTLQSGQSGRCGFCINEKLLDASGRPSGIIVWEFKNYTDGKWYQIYDRAIRWVDGRLVRMAIAIDVTKRKQAEDELEKHRGRLAELVEERTRELQMEIIERKRAEEELLKAQKLESVGLLAGGIAHDFNNILTSILTNLSLAKLTLSPGDDVYKRLLAAEKASLKAQDLTHQLLTFSRGGTPIRKTASIVDLLKESIDFALRGSNVRCDLNIPEDIWPVVIDEGQINQVINNLVINANQAMPSGGILRISASNVFVGKNEILPLKKGKYVKIAFVDNGIGIPHKYIHKIFDPYFTTKQEGSGLGLASTYSIIKNHDGHITVISEQGLGTTFDVYLPASNKSLEKEPEQMEDILHGSGRVLVMDDDVDILESLGDALSFFGYEVDFAEDGNKTIEMYQNALNSGNGFDAVIMDLTVPGGMGGAETIKKLKALDPSLKAIVSSGYSNDPILSNYREYGFRGIITKPYRIEDLSRMLHQVIKN